jgi:signal transduction histidine kinase/ActR/RegA family two-component response regulator
MGFRARLSLVIGLNGFAALLVGAGVAGFLVLRYRLAADLTRSAETNLGFLALGLVVSGVVLALLGWWGMVVLILRPVREVQRGAEALVQGQLERGEAAFRQDELSRVAMAMKAMASRMRQSKADVERHSIQLETLYRVSLSLTKRLDLESVLETVLNAAFELFPGLMDALVFFYTDDRLTLAASRRGPLAAGGVSPVPRPEGSTYRVAHTGEMVLIPDVHADPRYPGNQRIWPGALACIPLKVGAHVVGVLNASYQEAHAFGEEETRLLQLLADQTAIAVENARLYGQAQQELLERRRAELALQKANEDLERRVSSRTRALLEANQRLETLKEIDRAVLAAHSMDDIAMAGVSRLRALVGCEHADLVLFELEQGVGRLLAMEGPRTFGLETGTTFSLEDYGPVADLKAGEVRRVNDLKAMASLTPVRQRLLDGGVRSFLTVPLVADGTLIGELNLDSARAAAFDIDTELLAREVANQLAVALRQAGLRAALEAEQTRLGQLVEHLPQAVALLGSDKRVVLANAQARKILPELGRWPSTATLQQVGGRPIERLLVSAEHPGWHELRLEVGARRVYEAAALRLGDPPEGGGWIVQIRDVTSERSAQMQQRSQERLAAVGQLAAGVAHDFNNIISVIILYAEMLLQGQGRTPQDIERLQTITQQGQRAAQLIQQILDFSRQSVMDQHPFDLVPFLREMEGLLMRTMPEFIRVRVVAEGTGFMILGDPARIRQACINLALNAREAMAEGGELRFTLSPLSLKEGEPTPCVEMAPGEWVRLTVSDTGSGIQPEALPHIFEPFFTTKSPARASGLGLAQVYGIIQQHHGHIDVTSSREGGTTFAIFLPVLAAPESSEALLEESEANRGQGEWILVVEDNDATRASVSEILTNLGYRVLQASEGKEALEVFAQQAGKIDLILSDLVMPGMGGSELVRHLKAVAPEQRVLLMTGYPLGSTRELLESGTVHWLQKPLSGSKLARAVREALAAERGRPAPA